MQSRQSEPYDSGTSSGSSAPSRTSALDALYWHDEILQVMYWLLGEGFAASVTAADLRRFLDGDPATLAHYLNELAASDLVTRTDDAYALTEVGASEAQHRFVDEFRPLLGKTGHGECSDDCWCHDPDRAGEECPSHRHAELSA